MPFDSLHLVLSYSRNRWSYRIYHTGRTDDQNAGTHIWNFQGSIQFGEIDFMMIADKKYIRYKRDTKYVIKDQSTPIESLEENHPMIRDAFKQQEA